MREPFSGLLPEEIAARLPDEPAYRGSQIFSALHRGSLSFDGITTLSKTLRQHLKEEFLLSSSIPVKTLEDEDGTRKQQIELSEGTLIEAVLLSDKGGRKTACISTQAGCAMGCTFCKTGQLNLMRNLAAGEIVEQVLHLRSILDPGATIGNIVFMGMGEPLANLDPVRKAVAVLHHPEGANISLRKITLSTCGIIEGIEEMTDNGPEVGLAVSLNSADESVRSRLMPISRTNPLEKLKKSLLAYQEKRRKRITFEYVLIRGINDRTKDVELLVDFLDGLKGVVNLIPYNLVDGADFQSPGSEDTRRFINLLENASIQVVQRYRRGRGINGACGQLGVLA